MQKEVIVYSAEELNKAIKSSNCSAIKLGSDIHCKGSNGIVFENVSNKIIDGNGYKILGPIIFKEENKNFEPESESENIIIENCEIISESGSNGNSFSVFFRYTSHYRKIIIKNSKLIGTITFGYAATGEEVKLEECEIIGKIGILFDESLDIENVSIMNCNIKYTKYGIFFDYWISASDVYIINNTFCSNKNQIYMEDKNCVKNIIIEGCNL